MKRITAKRQDRFLFKRRLISVAVMSAMSSHASANPTGPQVVNGQVSVTTQGSVLTVTNTPNAIVNWQSFSIGGNETTRFVQQSAASAVLNRVVGVDPSVILGTLQSNGKVLLINTNGIVFGQGARVDVAGLVASTLNLNDQDFLAGRLNFQSSPLGSGSVVNRGTIATPEGGSVFLVGAAVENSGIIHAPGGEVILAAGQSVRLGSTGAPNVLVEVEAPANRAVNLGEIAVGAGKAGIYGGFVEQKGIVSANTATVNAAGKIVFKATRDTTVAAGSSTTASGAQGGTVAVESGGTTRVDGVVSATGASGKGGTIHLLGKQVGVAGGASVDASGAAGGGTILVGGDYKGGNPDVRNARATFVGADTQLRADATGAGDGGRIIVWSDEVTRAYGSISARGGPLGGDGGFVETSSAGYLEVIAWPGPGGAFGRRRRVADRSVQHHREQRKRATRKQQRRAELHAHRRHLDHGRGPHRCAAEHRRECHAGHERGRIAGGQHRRPGQRPEDRGWRGKPDAQGPQQHLPAGRFTDRVLGRRARRNAERRPGRERRRSRQPERSHRLSPTAAIS